MKTIMSKGVLWTFLVLLLTGLLAACSNPTSSDGQPITVATLQEAITRAENAKLGVRIAIDGSTIPTGAYWVTALEWGALETKITAAKGVLGILPVQSAIALAVKELNEAIDTFNAAKQPGNGADVNFDALIQAIKDARAAKDGVVVDTYATNVPIGTFWVYQTEMDTLETAIGAAEGVLDSDIDIAQGAIAQGLVDGAVTALNSAVTTFNDLRKAGTKP